MIGKKARKAGQATLRQSAQPANVAPAACTDNHLIVACERQHLSELLDGISSVRVNNPDPWILSVAQSCGQRRTIPVVFLMPYQSSHTQFCLVVGVAARRVVNDN